MTTNGTYASADVTNLKCWYATSPTFDASTATLLSTYNSPGTAGTKAFPSFVAQTIAAGSTGYVFVTADLAVAALDGDNISIGTT